MSDFSLAAQSRDTTLTLDIYSTNHNLEVCEGNARLFGKNYIYNKLIFYLACLCNQG